MHQVAPLKYRLRYRDWASALYISPAAIIVRLQWMMHAVPVSCWMLNQCHCMCARRTGKAGSVELGQDEFPAVSLRLRKEKKNMTVTIPKMLFDPSFLLGGTVLE